MPNRGRKHHSYHLFQHISSVRTEFLLLFQYAMPRHYFRLLIPYLILPGCYCTPNRLLWAPVFLGNWFFSCRTRLQLSLVLLLLTIRYYYYTKTTTTTTPTTKNNDKSVFKVPIHYNVLWHITTLSRSKQRKQLRKDLLICNLEQVSIKFGFDRSCARGMIHISNLHRIRPGCLRPLPCRIMA